MKKIDFLRIYIQYLNFLKKCAVGIGLLLFSGLASAGAYDDFFKALELDHPSTLQALLDRGFDPNTPHPQGTPALLRRSVAM